MATYKSQMAQAKAPRGLSFMIRKNIRTFLTQKNFQLINLLDTLILNNL